MRTRLTAILPAIVMISIALLTAPRAGVAKDRFIAPDITAAGQIPYPVEVVGAGLVTVSVNLDASGHATGVQVLRDIPGLTSLVSSLVKDWTYSPAKLDNSAVPSTINIEVVFNPGDILNQTLKIPPVAPSTPPLPQGYLPAEVAVGSYASYPINSVANDTVVLDVLLDKFGGAKRIDPVRDIASLTPEASAAIKRWTINAATFNQKAIPSKLVVAYVFRSPAIATR
jgi:hypothetical protein